MFLGGAKRIKHTPGNGGIDSWACVGHADFDLAGGGLTRANDNPLLSAIGRGKRLHRIVDQVDQHLLDLNAVNFQQWQAIGKLKQQMHSVLMSVAFRQG
jgi:hypothetical protein